MGPSFPIGPPGFGEPGRAPDTEDIVLSSDVADRATFYGLVSRARGLGLAVISVERREHKDGVEE